MLVLSPTSQKGGVAKTTTALIMSFGLLRRGYRVLAIDLDPQRNFSTTVSADLSLPTSLDVLAGDVSVAGAVQRLEGLDVVSASARGGKVDDVIGSAGRDHRLSFALSAVSDDYDYAVLDTPPSLGTLTINALTACDWVVIPACADVYSLDGVSDLSSTISAVQTYTNSALRIAGILLTRYSPRSNISRAIHDEAVSVAKDLNTRLFDTSIREAVAVREAQALGVDLFSFAPRSNVVADCNRFLDELLGVINGK